MDPAVLRCALMAGSRWSAARHWSSSVASFRLRGCVHCSGTGTSLTPCAGFQRPGQRAIGDQRRRPASRTSDTGRRGRDRCAGPAWPGCPRMAGSSVTASPSARQASTKRSGISPNCSSDSVSRTPPARFRGDLGAIARHHAHRDQVLEADEAGDEGIVRPLIQPFRRIELHDPAGCMMATRSEIENASSWSCVT